MGSSGACSSAAKTEDPCDAMVGNDSRVEVAEVSAAALRGEEGSRCPTSVLNLRSALGACACAARTLAGAIRCAARERAWCGRGKRERGPGDVNGVRKPGAAAGSRIKQRARSPDRGSDVDGCFWGRGLVGSWLRRGGVCVPTAYGRVCPLFGAVCRWPWRCGLAWQKDTSVRILVCAKHLANLISIFFYKNIF